MEKIYTSYRCARCGKEIILITGEAKSTLKYGNFLSCSHCGSKHLVKTTETDNLKECMQHNSYRRENGALRQVKNE